MAFIKTSEIWKKNLSSKIKHKIKVTKLTQNIDYNLKNNSLFLNKNSLKSIPQTFLTKPKLHLTVNSVHYKKQQLINLLKVKWNYKNTLNVQSKLK
jgi:hypothetical protein